MTIMRNKFKNNSRRNVNLFSLILSLDLKFPRFLFFENKSDKPKLYIFIIYTYYWLLIIYCLIIIL